MRRGWFKQGLDTPLARGQANFEVQHITRFCHYGFLYMEVVVHALGTTLSVPAFHP